MKEAAEKNLEDLSMQLIITVQCDFPFVGATLYLDLDTLFSVRPMNISI